MCHRPDTSKIFVCVGFGFFVELTLSEALKFIDKKSKILTSRSDFLTADAARIKAHIKLVMEVSNLFMFYASRLGTKCFLAFIGSSVPLHVKWHLF